MTNPKSLDGQMQWHLLWMLSLPGLTHGFGWRDGGACFRDDRLLCFQKRVLFHIRIWDCFLSSGWLLDTQCMFLRDSRSVLKRRSFLATQIFLMI